MTVKAQIDFDPIQLQKDLNLLFKQYGVSVGTGLTKDGVTILSQDERVNTINLPPPLFARAPRDTTA